MLTLSAKCQETISCEQGLGANAQGGDVFRTRQACDSGARRQRLVTPSFSDDGVLEGRTLSMMGEITAGTFSSALSRMSDRTDKADTTAS